MAHRVITRISIVALLLLVSLATVWNVQAGGACGGTYVVQWGDTLDMIASRCGITVASIYAANPGISGYLYAGQVLAIPTGSNTCNCQGNTSTSAYTVQSGDTFAGIASRYGVSVANLWAANPQVWDINKLYVGQVLNIPAAPWVAIVPTPTSEPPVPLSYGTVPAGAPQTSITLSNKAKADVYVSLQGTARSGATVIREYPVIGTMKAKVPAGWYFYVAWVGGRKFTGQFNAGGGSDHTVTFYRNKVVVE